MEGLPPWSSFVIVFICVAAVVVTPISGQNGKVHPNRQGRRQATGAGTAGNNDYEYNGYEDYEYAVEEYDESKWIHGVIE